MGGLWVVLAPFRSSKITVKNWKKCGHNHPPTPLRLSLFDFYHSLSHSIYLYLFNISIFLITIHFYLKDFYNTAWNEKGGTDPKICPSHYESYSQGLFPIEENYELFWMLGQKSQKSLSWVTKNSFLKQILSFIPPNSPLKVLAKFLTKIPPLILLVIKGSIFIGISSVIALLIIECKHIWPYFTFTIMRI